MIMAAMRNEDSGLGQGDRRSQPRVATLHLVAVLSVPLHGSAAMDALANAEHELAALAAAGLSNLAIARCSGKALRTVANQMASVFSTLRVASRYELAARLALCPRREDDQS